MSVNSSEQRLRLHRQLSSFEVPANLACRKLDYSKINQETEGIRGNSKVDGGLKTAFLLVG